MFTKILIANRGEIACRVIKTCRRLGIKTVAVYSEADRDALHVEMADEAFAIGPAPSAQSYLSIEAILAACRASGAQAVHPGYGFLSERPAFQQALAKEGIVFIGPDAEAIFAMGDKIESKKLAAKAGVSTVPGYLSAIETAEDAVKIARDIGYPVMIKASAGGGGKGMRLANNDEECREGFQSARNEARSSFADDRVFIEKFITQPRHIEIQILADRHGTCLYLGERECSIQRRHQKVIEEAPSPFLDEKTRRAMGEQAVALARAVGYVSAGTVEFIVDADRNFYFLEMNTRLQVEHPVTEWVTGLDLVEWMIRIAAGQPLSFGQDQVTMTGWAIESRIYAEDPFRNFLPSIGRLTRLQAPAESSYVRVDTGVYEGSEISMFYDPMIAKLITYGQTRDQAIAHMRDALDAYHIRGVSHNIPFLASIMAKDRFIDGRLSTNFIAEEYAKGFCADDLAPQDPDLLVAVAAFIHDRIAKRDALISGQLPGYEAKPSGRWTALFQDRSFAVNVSADEVIVEGRVITIESDWQIGSPLLQATIDGRPITLQVEKWGIGYRLYHGGARADIRVLHPRTADLMALMPEKPAPDLSNYLLSPMPGLLVSVSVEEGQEVKAGDVLAVIEAMKMENILRAERDGRVAKLHSKAGENLKVDQIIIEFAA